MHKLSVVLHAIIIIELNFPYAEESAARQRQATKLSWPHFIPEAHCHHTIGGGGPCDLTKFGTLMRSWRPCRLHSGSGKPIDESFMAGGQAHSPVYQVFKQS